MSTKLQRVQPTLTDSLQYLKERITAGIEAAASPTFVPSGLQEDIIYNMGNGNHNIILSLHANDVGKTTAGVNILRNLIWPHDPTYFSYWNGYSVFRDKEFKLKTFRIASEHTHLKETGALQIEIEKWWPKHSYTWLKGDVHYPSECTTDTGWRGDALSYNMDANKFESKKLSFLWFDEPPKNISIIGACTSRFAEDGMLWLITATPIRAGAFLDVIDDLKLRGSKIIKLTGTADENHIDTGKRNHLNTKSGLRTTAQIEEKKANTPLSEWDARINGKEDYKAGRVYEMFNRTLNVCDYDLSSKYVKSWNCFTSIDPHDKAYPFVQMWGWAPDDCLVCYNEWPTYEELGNHYYDEMRNDLACTYDIETISRFIKIFEGKRFGLSVMDRYMDPRYGRGTIGIVGSPESLMSKYLKYGLDFKLPKCEKIEIQRDKIRNYLKVDPHDPIARPKIQYMSHCVSSIRMMERHYWQDGGLYEADQYKEGPDCLRILLSGLEGTQYINIEEVAKNKKFRPRTEDPIISKMRELAGIGLG